MQQAMMTFIRTRDSIWGKVDWYRAADYKKAGEGLFTRGGGFKVKEGSGEAALNYSLIAFRVNRHISSVMVSNYNWTREWSDTLDDQNANLIYLAKHLDLKDVG